MSINAQTIIDKITALTFELTEIINIQVLCMDLSVDEKMELSQNEYDLDEKIYRYLLILNQCRWISVEKNTPFNFDFSTMNMATDEREQATTRREQRSRHPVKLI